jgi:hypothetical protein
VPRNPGDNPCRNDGQNLTPIHEFSQTLNLFVAIKLISREMCTLFMQMHRTASHVIFNDLGLIRHKLREVGGAVLADCRRHNPAIDDAFDLRVSFLMGEIEEDQFRNEIELRDRLKSRLQDRVQIYETFERVAADLFHEFYVQLSNLRRDYGTGQNAREGSARASALIQNLSDQFTQVIAFSNEAITRHNKRFGCKIGLLKLLLE